jgi:hypothetical protein
LRAGRGVQHMFALSREYCRRATAHLDELNIAPMLQPL